MARKEVFKLEGSLHLDLKPLKKQLLEAKKLLKSENFGLDIKTNLDTKKLANDIKKTKTIIKKVVAETKDVNTINLKYGVDKQQITKALQEGQRIINKQTKTTGNIISFAYYTDKKKLASVLRANQRLINKLLKVGGSGNVVELRFDVNRAKLLTSLKKAQRLINSIIFNNKVGNIITFRFEIDKINLLAQLAKAQRWIKQYKPLHVELTFNINKVLSQFNALIKKLEKNNTVNLTPNFTDRNRARVSGQSRSTQQSNNNNNVKSYLQYGTSSVSINLQQSLSPSIAALVLGVQKAVQVLVQGFSTALEITKQIAKISLTGLQKFSSLDETIQTLKALSVGTKITDADIKKLNTTIKETATSLPLSVEEISKGVVILKRAGQSMTQIQENITPVSKAAVATAESFDLLADVATTANTVFKNVTIDEVLDKLSNSANRSKLEFRDFAQSLKTIKGIDIDINTYSSLSQILADIGIRGSSSGTAIRNFFTFAKKNAEDLQNLYNINVFDSNGALRDQLELVKEIARVLPSLSDLEKYNLSRLFGERGGAVVQALDTSGLDGLLVKLDQLKNSIGLIDKQVEIMMQGFSGAAKQFSATLDAALTFDIGQGLSQLGATVLQTLTETIRQITGDGTLQAELASIGDTLRFSLMDINGNLLPQTQQNLNTLAEVLRQSFTGIIESLSNLFVSIINNAQNIQNVLSFVGSSVNVIITTVTNLINLFSQFIPNITTIQTLITNIGLFLQQLFNDIILKIEQLRSVFVFDQLQVALNNTKLIIGELFLVITNIGILLTNIVLVVTQIAAKIIDGLLPSTTSFGQIITSIQTMLLNIIQQVNNVVLYLNNLLIPTQQTNVIIESIVTKIRQTIDFLANIYQQIISGISQLTILKNTWELIKNSIRLIGELYAAFYQNLLNTITSFLTPILQALTRRLMPLLDSIVRFGNAVLRALNFMWETLKNILFWVNNINKNLNVMQSIGVLIGEVINFIRNVFELITRIITIILDICVKIADVLKLQHVIAGLIGAAYLAISVTVKVILEIINAILKVINFVLEITNNILATLQDTEKISRLCSDVWLGITYTLKQGWEWLKSIVKATTDFLGITKQVQSLWNGLIASIKQAFSLMQNLTNTFGNIGSSSKNNTSSGSGGGKLKVRLSGGKIYNLSEAETARLLGVAILEDTKRNNLKGRIAVVQTIFNRLGSQRFYKEHGRTVTSQVFGKGQFQPYFKYKPSDIRSKDDIIKIIMKDRGASRAVATKLYDELFNALSNSPKLVNSVAVQLGGRTNFKGYASMGQNMVKGEDVLIGDNFFHISGYERQSDLTSNLRRATIASVDLTRTISRSINTAGNKNNVLIGGVSLSRIMNYKPTHGQSDFAYRAYRKGWHNGTDFGSRVGATVGKQVYALHDGKVISVYGLGGQFAGQKGVKIQGRDSQGNKIYHALNHLSGVVVRVGQTIKQGQLVGRIANDGGNTHLDVKTRINDVPTRTQQFIRAMYSGGGTVRGIRSGRSYTVRFRPQGDSYPIIGGQELNSNSEVVAIKTDDVVVQTKNTESPVAEPSPKAVTSDEILSKLENQLARTPDSKPKTPSETTEGAQDKTPKKPIELPKITSVRETDLGLIIDGDDVKTIEAYNKHLEDAKNIREELLKNVQRGYEQKIDLIDSKLLDTEDPIQRQLLENEKRTLQVKQDLNLVTQKRLFYQNDINKLDELTNQNLQEYINKYQELIELDNKNTREKLYQNTRSINKNLVSTIQSSIDKLKQDFNALNDVVTIPENEEQKTQIKIKDINDRYIKLTETLDLYTNLIKDQLDESLSSEQKNRLQNILVELTQIRLTAKQELDNDLKYLNQIRIFQQRSSQLSSEQSTITAQNKRDQVKAKLLEGAYQQEDAAELTRKIELINRQFKLKQDLLELEKQQFEIENMFAQDPERLNLELNFLAAKREAIKQTYDLEQELVQQQIQNESLLGQIRQSLYDNISSNLHDIILNSKSVTDAFRDMISNILSLIIKSGIQKVLNSLFSSVFGGGLFSGSSNNGFLFFNSGGYVNQGSSANKDSVLAGLTKGEYVLSRDAVDAIGVDTLNLMNTAKFNSGGFVGSTSTKTPSFGRQKFTFETVRIGSRDYVETSQLQQLENRMNYKIAKSEITTQDNIFDSLQRNSSVRNSLGL